MLSIQLLCINRRTHEENIAIRMGGSLVQVNKPDKSRFSSKASRHLHRTSAKDRSVIAKTERNVAKGARAARIQRNKMMRDLKRAALLKEKRKLSESRSPSRVIVLFGLSASVDLHSLAKDLLSLLSKEASGAVSGTVASSEHGTRTTVLKAPHGDLFSCMEMAKVADLMAFVASACSFCEENDSYYIDSFGNRCLSVFRSIGLPSTAVFVRDLPTELKLRNELKKMCNLVLPPKFLRIVNFFTADTKDELHKFLWLFKEQRLKVPHWQTQRPYLIAEKVLNCRLMWYLMMTIQEDVPSFSLVIFMFTASVNQLVISKGHWISGSRSS